jgi:fibronectin-binding autotransporter adhesin
VYVETGGQLNSTVNGTFANVPLVLNGVGPAASNAGGALRFNYNAANITWPGAITLESTSQITFFSTGNTYTFSQPITGIGGIQFRGGGAANNHYHTAILAAASTYAGNTTAFGDAANITLQLSGVANALPTTTVLTLAGDSYNGALRGWLDLNGNSQTLAGLLMTNGARGAGDDRVVNSTSTNATLTIATTTADTFAGVLGGGTSMNNFNLSVTGTATLTLSGVNTYTGYTSVTGGTLALAAAANNIAFTPAIDVETGATLNVSGITGGCVLGTGQTLSGIGSIVGAITISGRHQPGVGGTETFANGVTFAATAQHIWQLLANVTTGAGTSFDQVAVTGTATVKSGAVVNVNLAATGSQVNLTNTFWTQPHTWTILTATSVSGTFAIGTAGSDPSGNPAAYYGAFSVAQSGTAVALNWTPFPPFTVWLNTHFGANAGNAAIAGPTANPAGDGINNLLKYALGLNPNVASVAGLPAVSNAGGYLQMSFARNVAATDITYAVQASNDLATWTSIATLAPGASGWTTAGSTVVDNSGQVTVTDGTAMTNPGKRFLRLEVLDP